MTPSPESLDSDGKFKLVCRNLRTCWKTLDKKVLFFGGVKTVFIG